MRILVVGMGLIGGSICKSIKAATSHAVYGCDIQPKVLEDAAADGAIDGAGTMTDGTYDMIILCLHHRIAVQMVQEALPKIPAGTILVDTCGLKGRMVRDHVPLPESRRALCGNAPHGRQGEKRLLCQHPRPVSECQSDRNTCGRHRRGGAGYRQGTGKADGIRQDRDGDPDVARQHDRLHLSAGARGFQLLCQGFLHGRCPFLFRRQLSGYDPCCHHG